LAVINVTSSRFEVIIRNWSAPGIGNNNGSSSVKGRVCLLELAAAQTEDEGRLTWRIRSISGPPPKKETLRGLPLTVRRVRETSSTVVSG
jgi:hypothetical protein